MNTNTTKPAQCAFRDLEDGEVFHLALNRIRPVLWQRVNESNDYNAVAIEKSSRCMCIPDDAQVVRVRNS